MLAELRPGSGKKQLRRTTPANPSGVGKPQRGARPRRSRRRSWARRMLLNGGYGERRSKLVAEQSRRGKTGMTTAATAIYSREGVVRRRQRTPTLATAPAACQRAKKRQNPIGGDLRVAPAASREVEVIFEIITELSLGLFFKLLTNFLKKLKISKNESCSIFQTLQLCF